MAGEIQEVDDATTDDAFSAGFDQAEGETTTPSPELLSEPATPAPAEAVVTPEAAPAAPEYVQLTRAELEDLRSRIGGIDPADIKRRIDQANGRIGSLTQRISQPATVEIKPEDFPELEKEYGAEFVAAHVAGLNRALGKQRPASPTEAEPATAAPAQVDTLERDRYLNDVVDGDWLAAVQTDAFGQWLGGQADDVKALAASDKTSDAARMLRLYRRDLVAKPVPAPVAATPAAAPAAASTRSRRLSAAVSPRGIPGAAPAPDEDEAFNEGFGS